MYVAAYCDWGIDLDDVAFFDQELARFVAEVAHGGFRDCLAGAEVGYGAVEIGQQRTGRGELWRKTGQGRSC